jgi:hypothetical protein
VNTSPGGRRLSGPPRGEGVGGLGSVNRSIGAAALVARPNEKKLDVKKVVVGTMASRKGKESRRRVHFPGQVRFTFGAAVRSSLLSLTTLNRHRPPTRCARSLSHSSLTLFSRRRWEIPGRLCFGRDGC